MLLRPGVRRLLKDLIEHANQNRGTLPKSRLVRYSPDEIDDIRVSLSKSQWASRGPHEVAVRVDRMIDDYGSDVKQALEAWSKATGVLLVDRKAQADHARSALRGSVQSWTFKDAIMTSILALVEARTGWVAVSLRHDGVETTSRRLGQYGRFFDSLDLAQGESLREFLAQYLGNSHAFDEDATLRRAVENEVKRRSQVEDLDAAYGALGIIRRVGYPVAVWQGRITFQTAAGPIESNAWDRGLPDSLPEVTLRETRIINAPSVAVFVENPSAWMRLCQQRLECLVVLTDGFPNHATHLLAAQLRAAGVECYFWGDIDAGGFRIHRVLNKTCPMATILMDRQTLHQYRDALRDLTDEKRSTLDGGHEVQAECLHLEGWLEQERIDPMLVIEALSRS